MTDSAPAPIPPTAAAGGSGKRRCGTLAVIGRPNVGKSTLVNALVGQKVSITSDKAQTTRHRIMGVRVKDDAQFIFIDTPGFQTRHAAALNRALNRAVKGAVADVDLVLFVVQAGRFGLADARALAIIPRALPTVLVANKLDRVQRRTELLPWLRNMQERHPFVEFVPMSAHSPRDVERLLDICRPHLPEQPWRYAADMLTDRSERFLAAEVVREKLFRLTGDELPYTSAVVIDSFSEDTAGGARRRVKIAASIIVERAAHKGMVIGAGGERLKRIGSEARQELERRLDAGVFLELWVQVRSGWADDAARVRAFGYE